MEDYPDILCRVNGYGSGQSYFVKFVRVRHAHYLGIKFCAFRGCCASGVNRHFEFARLNNIHAYFGEGMFGYGICRNTDTPYLVASGGISIAIYSVIVIYPSVVNGWDIGFEFFQRLFGGCEQVIVGDEFFLPFRQFIVCGTSGHNRLFARQCNRSDGIDEIHHFISGLNIFCAGYGLE